MVGEKLYKGAILNAYLKVIKKKFGIKDYRDVMSTVGISEHPRDVEWISADKVTRALEWVVKKYGEDMLVVISRDIPKNMGIFSTFFMSFSGIDSILKRLSAQLKLTSSFVDGGVDTNGNKAKITLFNARISEYSCLAYRGILEGTFRMKNKKCEITNNCTDSDCIYDVVWE